MDITSLKELGTFLIRSDILGYVLELGAWTPKRSWMQNRDIIHSALSRLEEANARAANAEIASRQAPNESALELRVRTVLLHLNVPCLGANLSSVQTMSQGLYTIEKTAAHNIPE